MSGKADIVILAIPVYYGRVPEEIISYLTSLKAERTPVVLVAVYENSAFEDSLKEFHDIAVDAKFLPVAGGAFAAEHSYSSKIYPIAPNLPDESNVRKGQEFGAAIRKKLLNVKSLEDLTALTIQGQFPYTKPEYDKKNPIGCSPEPPQIEASAPFSTTSSDRIESF